MDIVIDLAQFKEFASQPAYVVFGRMLYIFGWIPISFVMLWGFKELWIFYIRVKWSGMQRYMLLAIDIPRGNDQSPKAVENMFSYLAGAHASINLIENYWEGKVQLAFSMETVSIDGYTQFLIRTPVQFRDLVESAVYAQYPDAEITEVNDYTEGMPTKFPDDEYDVYGAEFIQTKPPAFPIKTYEEFEHQMGDPKIMYRDPMAALMDLTSSLRKGEQLWYQLIIVPTGFDWPEIGEKEISKVLGEKVKTGKNIADRIIDGILKMMEYFSEMVFRLWGDIEEKKEEKEEEKFRMMNLKPREKKQVEAIQNKVGKLGFEFKIRFVYIAKKDVMNKPKVASGFVGFMKQFASMDLNNLKPDMDITATTAHYFFKERRLNKKKYNIVWGYKKRDKTLGRQRGILNIEELATIWHFPVETAVKAPLIQKASRRKAEPPMGLPTSVETVGEELKEPFFEEEEFKDIAGRETEEIISEPSFLGQESSPEEPKPQEETPDKGVPPGNLPFV
jgi:hypothetical protein